MRLQSKTRKGLFINIQPRFHAANCCTNRGIRTHRCLTPEMVAKTTRAFSKSLELFMLHWRGLQFRPVKTTPQLFQTCCVSHHSLWPPEPGSQNLPTAVGPSAGPERPQPDSFTNVPTRHYSTQSTHGAMTAYAANLLEVDCVASAVTNGARPLTSDVVAEATLPPPDTHG